MDTESFFRAILPASGLKILAELVRIPGQDRAGWRYHTFESMEAMAEAVHQLDGKGRTVYHACNSFGPWYEENGKRRIRTQKNVVACRSLYDDIDVGKKDCYQTRNEAITHIKEFLAATGVPTPMVISSGSGIHLYWPLDRDVPPLVWAELSAMKRAALSEFGVKFDSGIGSDSARVLRPVGSTWRKNGEVPVTVKLRAGPYSVEQLSGPLARYLATRDALPPPTAAAAAFAELGDDLSARDYPPSSLSVVAEHCAQVRAMRDTQGDIGYEHWRGVIGLGRYCTDPYELLEEWSSRRGETGHAQTNVRHKYDTWSAGPTTCDFFRKANAAGCEGCPHQVKSPIQLGYTPVTEAPTVVVEPVAEKAAPARPAEPAQPEHWPEGYRVIDGSIACFVEDENEDGVGKWARFARPLFYPTERVRIEDGTYALRMVMQVKAGARLREFLLPTKAAVDGRALRTALGAYEITVSNDKLALRYMSDYLASLRKSTEERHTFQQFGWRDDFSGFLIGDKLITPTDITVVQISDGADRGGNLRKAYDVRGTEQEWIDGVNTLYNRPNGEPYQYAICTVFGSVLAPVMGYEEWNGIPLALTSEDSGYGKSTVAKIAINALCNSNVTTVTDCTPYAVLKRASVQKNLCVLFDEVTNNVRQRRDTAGLSDVLYALSNGKGRVRLGADGAERKPDPPWCLMSILTGNRNMMFNLTESKVNPEAAQMRVFEVDMENYPPLASMSKDSEIHEEHQQIALHILNNVTSVLAAPYIRYVMANLETVQKALQTTAAKLVGKLGGRAAKERFYAYHVACVLVGGQIAKKLGYIQFDLQALSKWALQHIGVLRREAARYNYTTEEQFSMLLSDLHGRIIVTKNYESLDSRHGKTELPILPVRNPIAGRLVLGSETEKGRLFLSVRAIDDWCRERGVSVERFKQQLVAAGIAAVIDGAPAHKPVRLSRGVPSLPTGVTRVMEVRFEAAQGYVEGFVTAKQEDAECATA